MIIIGIDPGSTRAGWGVISFTKRRAVFIAAGIVKVLSTNKNERLVDLEKSFEKIIKKYKPDHAGIEKLYFVKNQKTGLEVAQSRGVLTLIVAKNNIPINEFTPNEIKQGITGYGTADKKAVTKMVRMILKLDDLKQPDDVYDALATALITGYAISK
ncbi:MAG: crossover junction endodeoxyribonuclease RuvC [Candidatus Pacebacteria bacterium]|nr:crossover junction endodeoxyribonuclease RuvC [Candidatus Paceibacterota bacterium]